MPCLKNMYGKAEATAADDYECEELAIRGDAKRREVTDYKNRKEAVGAGRSALYD